MSWSWRIGIQGLGGFKHTDATVEVVDRRALAYVYSVPIVLREVGRDLTLPEVGLLSFLRAQIPVDENRKTREAAQCGELCVRGSTRNGMPASYAQDVQAVLHRMALMFADAVA